MNILKKHWQLTLFVIAVLSISGYLFYQSQQTPELNATRGVVQTSDTAIEKVPVGDTSQGGHWHGDEWHAEPHTVPTQKLETSTQSVGRSLEAGDANNVDEKLFHELTPKERAKIWEAAYRENMDGASPPPGYIKAAEEKLQAILKSMDEPRVIVQIVTGFAPNQEQLVRYLELREQLREARARGEHTEADIIQLAMDRLEAQAQGDVPLITGSWSNATAKSKVVQAMKERNDQAYRELGLGHMVEAGVSGLPQIKPTIH